MVDVANPRCRHTGAGRSALTPGDNARKLGAYTNDFFREFASLF